MGELGRREGGDKGGRQGSTKVKRGREGRKDGRGGEGEIER